VIRRTPATAPSELPRREHDHYDTRATGPGFRSQPELPAVRAALTDLQLLVPGVRGCVLAGTDGLLITHNLPPGPDPHDLSALAATTFGVGRQCGLSLGQGPFRDSTVRSNGGYFTVYAIGERALLAVLGDDGLNVARLHIEARPVAERLGAMLPW
jgi:predicted regulator of Ras-like GTPase activity (Roadblock/LC7/MglB family)